MHRLPILDVYCRSRMASRDPEAILRSVIELTIAVDVATQAESARSLTPLGQEFKETLNRLMFVMGGQHFSREANQRLTAAAPGAEERVLAERVLERLRPCLSGVIEDEPPEDLLVFICRARLFLAELDVFSEWTRDHRGHDLIRV